MAGLAGALTTGFFAATAGFFAAGLAACFFTAGLAAGFLAAGFFDAANGFLAAGLAIGFFAAGLVAGLAAGFLPAEAFAAALAAGLAEADGLDGFPATGLAALAAGFLAVAGFKTGFFAGVLTVDFWALLTGVGSLCGNFWVRQRKPSIIAKNVQNQYLKLENPPLSWGAGPLIAGWSPAPVEALPAHWRRTLPDRRAPRPDPQAPEA